MRVKGLSHYGLEVPSLEVGQSFYRTFGLQVDERDGALVVRCAGREQDQPRLDPFRILSGPDICAAHCILTGQAEGAMGEDADAEQPLEQVA